MRGSSSRHPRDSDASFASSRRSSGGYGVGGGGQPLKVTDPAYKQTAIRYLNAYFAAHNFHIALSLKQLPTGPVITEIFRFLFTRLEFVPSSKIEDDLPVLLKALNCPHKIGKSNIKALGTPHAFPNTVAVMHWLAQLAGYNDHLSAKSSTGGDVDDAGDSDYDALAKHALQTYSHFMRCEDDVVDRLKQNFMEKLDQQRDIMRKDIESLELQIPELESKLQSLRTGPSPLEALDTQRAVLEKDVEKFTDFIGTLKDGINDTKKDLQNKEKELEAKVVEYTQICEENEELRKKIEAQGIDIRAAEMMKRELKCVERETDAADSTRRLWEEKCWELDSKIGMTFKEMEKLSVECNQSLRRLKFGNGFQYTLNPQGLTVADVLGIDYKSTIKPAINSLADEMKQSSIKNSEELVALQQQATEITARIKMKTTHIYDLQQHITETQARLNSLKKEVEDCEAKCTAEARRMVEDFELEARNLELMDKEAKENLKAVEMKLLEVEEQMEDEIQKCARELVALVDLFSKKKESIELKISEMEKKLSEANTSLSDAYKSTLTYQFGISLDDAALTPAGKRRKDDK